MSRRRQLYEGKAKILYEGPEPGTIIQYFKDDATAFNAQKRGTILNKGVINNRVSERLFRLLEQEGVPTHFIERISDREMLTKKVTIVPVEVVVRNIVAGSLAKRLALSEGMAIEHGQSNVIAKNVFIGEGTGIRLWQNATQDPNWGYPKNRDTRSRDYVIEDNHFLENKIAIDVRETADVRLQWNRFFEVSERLKLSGATPGLKDPSSADFADPVAYD